MRSTYCAHCCIRRGSVRVHAGERSINVSIKWHLELGVPGILIMSRSSAGRSPNGGHRIGSSSPPPRRPRHRDGGRVIEQVVEKSTVGIVYPMPTRMNYTEWSVVMRVNS
jgi:hypothetical protein